MTTATTTRKTWHFSWTGRDRTITRLSFSECTEAEAYEHASQMGWTKPRWWQWWRWSEDNYVRSFF